MLRKIDKALNFDFIYDEVKDLYSDTGRPGIAPVVLVKIVMIQYLFGIKSMRQTIKDIEVNLAYRWFLGYSFTEKISVPIVAKKYANELEKEINLDRESNGKKPLGCKDKEEFKTVVQSITYKDSGMFYKDKKEKCFDIRLTPLVIRTILYLILKLHLEIFMIT